MEFRSYAGPRLMEATWPRSSHTIHKASRLLFKNVHKNPEPHVAPPISRQQYPCMTTMLLQVLSETSQQPGAWAGAAHRPAETPFCSVYQAFVSVWIQTPSKVWFSEPETSNIMVIWKLRDKIFLKLATRKTQAR